LAGGRRLARVSKTPGRTQTINFYALDPALSLADLPGYGYARAPQSVREAWGPMIESYLASRDALKLVLVLIDGRHGPTDDDLILWRWLEHIPAGARAVATKWDKVKKFERSGRIDAITESLGVAPIPFSAVDRTGHDELVAILRSLSGS